MTRKKIIIILILFIIIFTSVKIYLNHKENASSNIMTKLSSSPTSIDISKYRKDYKITKEGTYTLTGATTNSIIVNAKNKKIVIRLDNLVIESQNKPAIKIKNAKSVTLESLKNTTNSLSSTNSKDIIKSNSNMVIEGEGTLEIEWYTDNQTGINTKKDLLIKTKNISIKQTNLGIKSNNLNIKQTNLYIESNKGIKSNTLNINQGNNIVATTGNTEPLDITNEYKVEEGLLLILSNKKLESNPETKQKIISIKTQEDIKKNHIITITDQNKKEVLSFVSNINLSTLLLTKDNLKSTTYKLYETKSHTGTLNNIIYENGTPDIKDEIKQIKDK